MNFSFLMSFVNLYVFNHHTQILPTTGLDYILYGRTKSNTRNTVRHYVNEKTWEYLILSVTACSVQRYKVFLL